MSDVSRREFVSRGAVGGAGLLLAFTLPPARGPLAKFAALAGPGAAGLSPNAWLRLDADGGITVRIDSCEMGQGVQTSLPMILAEELDVDFAKIRCEFATMEAAYVSPKKGRRGTGGSNSIRSQFDLLRRTGAAGRAMLITAAAQRWGVAADECRTEPGVVVHPASGRRATYGELADAAGALPVPENPVLKDPKDFRIIGTRVPRLDTKLKVTGQAQFGIDVRVPGMLTAVVARCAACGGAVKSVDDAAAKKIPGVRAVVPIDGGVAVVADSLWPAKKGRDALVIEWDERAIKDVNSESIARSIHDAAASAGVVAHAVGYPAATPTMVEATYSLPYLAHATMEPMNCTAFVTADRCEIWAPTQGQSNAQATAMRLTGLPAEKITIHTTYLGGGFGRRSEADFVADAVQISRAVGAPVQVVWMREDDIRNDFYRPTHHHTIKVALDERGYPSSWTHHVVAPSVLARWFPQAVRNGVDGDAVSGLDDEFRYAVPNRRVTYAMLNVAVPVGWWRSVGESATTFVIESMIDEAAARHPYDPVEYRRQLLTANPRLLGVLNLAAEKAGWSTPAPAGRARGVALGTGFGSYVAQIAEVSVDRAKGDLRVHKVVCAVDCGQVVNPAIVEAQMESAIVYGLTAALKGEITVAGGKVQQSNFHDYQMLRMREMPVVETYIVPSRERPGGIGEPGTPPIAPAVANAIFAATGKRLRKLPIRAADLKA